MKELYEQVQKPWVILRCIKDFHMTEMDGGNKVFSEGKEYLFVFDDATGSFFALDDESIGSNRLIKHYLDSGDLNDHFEYAGDQ